MSDPTTPVEELAGLHNRLVFPQAVELARAGRYEDARQWVEFLLKREPTAQAYCLLGKIHGQQARYHDAAAAFEHALTLDAEHQESREGLACVRRLGRPVPASALRRWQFVSSLAVLVAIIAIVFAAGRRTASRSPAAAPAPPSPTLTDAVELMTAFGTLRTTVQSFGPLVDVTLRPSVADGRGVVIATGTVPSPFLRSALMRALTERAGVLKLDASAIQVSGRYVVQPRDTFYALAPALCGPTGTIAAFRAANRTARPGRLQLGTSIVVPCQSPDRAR